MPEWRRARKVVKSAIQSGQIGRPVAIRFFTHIAGDAGHIEVLAAEAIAAASEWVNDHPELIAAQGGANEGHVTVLTRMTAGQTVLATAGVDSSSAPAIAVLVVGNRGTLSWESHEGGALERETVWDSESPQLAAQLVQPLLTSLESKQVVNLSAHDGGVRTLNSPESPGISRRVGFPAAQRAELTPQAPPYGVLLVAGDRTNQSLFARSLAADPRCKLIGVVDEADVSERRRELNERFAERLKLPLLPDLQKALLRDDVHIVSVCAESYRRSNIIVQAAEAGKHLYLDKPLSCSLEDAAAAAEAVNRAGVVGHMYSMFRSRYIARVREVIQSRQLGELTALHMDLCFAKGHGGTADLGQPRRETSDPDRFELQECKRELTNVGVYSLAHLLWLVKRPIKRVFCTTGNYIFAEHQTHDMEDFGQILCEFEGGLTATVSAGRTGWQSHPSFGLSRSYLSGSHGAVVLSAHHPRVEIWTNGQPWDPPKRNPEDPMGMWEEMDGSRFAVPPKSAWMLPDDPVLQSDVSYFLDCIEQGRQSEMSAGVAAAATEVLVAAYRSAAAGCYVEIA